MLITTHLVLVWMSLKKKYHIYLTRGKTLFMTARKNLIIRRKLEIMVDLARLSLENSQELLLLQVI